MKILIIIIIKIFIDYFPIIISLINPLFDGCLIYNVNLLML